MTYWLMQNYSCKQIHPVACFFLLAILVLSPSVTQAKSVSLDEIIPGLYGGNGFQTDPNFAGNQSNDFGKAVFDSFNTLTNGIGSQIGQFAVNSTVAAFRFDVERGVPVEVTKSLGPLFGERADTIGKGRFDFQVVWSNADYKKFNGQKLSSLSANVPATVPPFGTVTGEQLRIDLDVTVITNFIGFFGTYGLTDNWDVNLLVPLINNKIKAKSRATILDANGVPCSPLTPNALNCDDVYVIDGTAPNTGDPSKDTSSGDKTGIGDILVRSKYNFLKNHETLPDLGVRGGVSFPTGNEHNFMGVGEFKFEGLAVASKYYSAPIGVIGPHLNTGMVLVNNKSELNLFTYVAGFDFAPIPVFAFSLDLLGRHELDDKDNSGKDIVDLAPGMKWAPMPNTLLQAAVQLPLNKNEGLRPDAIWTLGVGATF